MNNFLFFLVTIGFPVTGITIVLVYFITNTYRERRFLIEKGMDISKNSSLLSFSKTAILRSGIISIGLSFGMLAGILLMDFWSNPLISDDEGIAWGITIPLFLGLSLLVCYFIDRHKLK